MASTELFMDMLAGMLRSHRKAACLTQAELARISGVGKTAVFDLEHGKSTVRMDTVLRLCETLNIQLRLLGPLDLSSSDSA